MRVRKYKKTRSPHCIMLVICEGETEETYVNLLKRFYRLPIAIKTKVSGNYINSRLVSQYIKELDVAPDECDVFYIYDADVKPVLDKIISLPGISIISNPCIELWFTLHMRDVCRTFTTEAILKELCSCIPIWKSYGKGRLSKEQGQHLLDHTNEAVTRAKKLQWLQNPSSNMYDFIEALESAKKLK